MAAPKRFAIPSLDDMENDHLNVPIKKPRYNNNEESKVSESREPQSNNIKSQPSNSADPLRNESKEKFTSEPQPSMQSQNSESNEDTQSTVNTISSTNKAGSSSSLLVNPRQRGNPILKSVRNVAWEYGNIVPDYVMGQSNCALFLSLRYHQLHPNYIHERLKQLGRSFDLRVMLVQVDVKEPQHLLRDLAKICILADCTLVLAFSPEEAGRYLETYKIFENKPAEALMEKTEDNFMAKFTDCLTRVKSVNKTDCSTLLSHFGSLSEIIDASEEDLSLCPGFGPQKAHRLHSLFHEPFLRSSSSQSPNTGLSPNKRKL